MKMHHDPLFVRDDPLVGLNGKVLGGSFIGKKLPSLLPDRKKNLRCYCLVMKC